MGIISERDYARKVILKDKSSKTTRVSEVMTREVISVEPRDRISHCVNLMTSHHIRHLVVMNEGQVAGMLSLRDQFAEIIDEQSETIGQLEDYIRGRSLTRFGRAADAGIGRWWRSVGSALSGRRSSPPGAASGTSPRRS